jgi:hypothetical protein
MQIRLSPAASSSGWILSYGFCSKKSSNRNHLETTWLVQKLVNGSSWRDLPEMALSVQNPKLA